MITNRPSAETTAAKQASVTIKPDVFAMQVAQNAVKALLYEVSVSPKPGLVDRFDSGAHSDMDYFTFLNSSCALFPYFFEMAAQGMLFEKPPDVMLPFLRKRGKQAEKEMLAATQDVNTHKGLIFSLGILCACSGYLYKENKGIFTPENLLDTAAAVAGGALKDFAAQEGAKRQTNGKRLFEEYGLTGIRGEAAAGFPSVRRYSYPVLCRLIKEGYSANDAGLAALLHLMAFVVDTNIISRSNIETQKRIQDRVRQLVGCCTTPELLKKVPAMNDEFITVNVSPGGCADLLAISFYLYFQCGDAV